MAAAARGERAVARLDLATARWETNEFGVDVLMLSRDTVSGAFTFALRCPPGLVYPEGEHFYDCDQDLFQFEGEFHHDELVSFREGDYVFRPAGTIYGHGEGSEGGIIVASLGREPCRFLFDHHPGPWTGHYRVDRLWNPGRVDPFVVSSGARPWQPLGQIDGAAIQRLRGEPGARSREAGASAHSPWAADAVFLLRLPRGFAGRFPEWPGFTRELLVLGGAAVIAGDRWQRGCYSFGGPIGDCSVMADFSCYCRLFATTP